MDKGAVGQDTTGLMRRPTASLPGESAAGVVGGVPWLHDGPASARWGCAQGLVSLGFPVGGWKPRRMRLGRRLWRSRHTTPAGGALGLTVDEQPKGALSG